MMPAHVNGSLSAALLPHTGIEDGMLIRAHTFAVHVFTAAGAALALVALIYAVREQWAAMFLCLAVALIVDAVDGTIGRWLKVAEAFPRWSGDVLDLVVDFVTYVCVPAPTSTDTSRMPLASAAILVSRSCVQLVGYVA